MISWIQQNWLCAAVLAYAAGMTLYCHYRGFLRTVLSAASLILALICTRILAPAVSDWVSREMQADLAGSYQIRLICFLVLFLCLRMVISLVIKVSDLVTKLPVLHGLNEIGGAVLGLAIALVTIWVGDLVLLIFRASEWAQPLTAQVEVSPILSWIRANNQILSWIHQIGT